MAVLGLDVGTSGCKGTLLDETGNALAAAHHEYNAPAGALELHPDALWQGLRFVLQRIAQLAKEQRQPIQAVCVSSFGETFVLLDKQGRVLQPAMMYTDPRGTEESAQLAERFGLESVVQRTGAFPHPMYSLPKWMWLATHRPQVWQAIDRVCLIGDYVLYLLGGVHAIDRSLAARSMALDITVLEWDTALLDMVGLRKEQLSTVYPSGTLVGEISPHVAQELGLPAGIQLVTGGHDQVCAALGAGVVCAGTAVDGMGSVECMTPAFDAPLRARQDAFACIPHGVPGMYVTYAFNFTGGVMLKWFRDQLAPEVHAAAQRMGGDAYEELGRQAEALADGPTGLLVLPHFAGAGTPSMDVSATGAIVGLTLGTSRAQLYRAVMEGTAMEMRWNLDCLARMGIAPDTIHVVGGGAKSPLWMQIKADIYNRPVSTLRLDEAGTMGTAMLAWYALGVYPTLADAAKACVRVKRVYEPRKDMAARYGEQYARYCRMQAGVKGIMMQTTM